MLRRGHRRNGGMTFTVSPEEFADLQKRGGIPADQTHGQVVQAGVTAEWTYADGVLIVKILKRPWLMPMALIENQIRKWAGFS
jgi:hypothetical protein